MSSRRRSAGLSPLPSSAFDVQRSTLGPENMTHLHTITVSNIRVVNNFKCYHFGERTTPEDVAVSECTQITSAGNTRVYGVDKLCKNHSFILKGAFALVNLKLNFNPTNYAHK